MSFFGRKNSGRRGNFRTWFWQTGLVAATTIGAGIFSLPFIFEKAGWLTGVFYLLALGGLITAAHYLYWQALDKTGARNRLLGLAKNYFGEMGFDFAFLAVIGGLILAMVIHILLGGRFLKLIFPAIPWSWSVVIFWMACSLPLFLKLRRLVGLEFLGAVLIAAIIIVVFFTAGIGAGFGEAPVDFHNLFLPFGAVFFSLAAWTAVEPVYDFGKSDGAAKKTRPLAVFTAGTFLSALLYFLFVSGILGSASAITTDTISGLAGWPAWKAILLSVLGIFAIWTSYVPIGLEIKNSLEKDLGWRTAIGLDWVLFLPLLLIAAGFNNFLRVIGLAGGVFLSIQYLLIVLVSRKTLELGRGRKLLLDCLALVFVLGAVYEIYYFVLH